MFASRASGLLVAKLSIDGWGHRTYAVGEEDGFGARSTRFDPEHGRVERLDLTPALASLRRNRQFARAAFHNSLDHANSSNSSPESEMVLNSRPVSAPCASDGIRSTRFTGASYVDAPQASQPNRERLWRDFGVALPTAANLPRFDQRGDVTQIGAIVLASPNGAHSGANEYPRNTHEMAMSATVTGTTAIDAKLRSWLQDALPLHGRVTFGSAVDAARAFADVLPQRPSERSKRSRCRRPFASWAVSPSRPISFRISERVDTMRRGAA